MYRRVGLLRRVVNVATGLVMVLGVGLTDGAVAQSQVESSGFRLPSTTINDMDGVLGMDANPASLGFLKGSEGAIAVTKDGEVYTGTALLGARLFGPFSFGFSSSTGEGAVTRMGGVFAVGDEALSLGLHVRGLLRNRASDGDDSVGLDLGFTVRPSWWMSMSATLQNANDPLVNGVRTGEVGEFGLSLRPWTDRLTLGFGARVPVEQTGEWTPSFHVMSQPMDGFFSGPFGGRWSHSLQNTDGASERSYSMMALVGLDWGALGLLGGVDLQGLDSEEGSELGGYTIAARFSNEARGRLSRPSGQWARVSMGFLSERPTRGFLGVKKKTFLMFSEYVKALAEDARLDGVLFSLRGYRGVGRKPGRYGHFFRNSRLRENRSLCTFPRPIRSDTTWQARRIRLSRTPRVVYGSSA